MKRILFFHTHTLHSKFSIPVALELAGNGFQVCYLKNRPDFFQFSRKNIIDNPISDSFMNGKSLGYVAGQINFQDELDKKSADLLTTFKRCFSKYDAVISTTKDLPSLKKINRKFGVAAFALGYQHLPFLIRIGNKFRDEENGAAHSIFFKDNPFARDHGFRELFDENSGIILNNFTYLDKVYSLKKSNDLSGEKAASVLIFHPGGYRKVLTEPGASRKISYEQQKDFIVKICLPILKAGLIPVIKIHPLHARYHGLDDLKEIAADVETRNGLSPGSIRITDDWFWNYAFKSVFALTFGSSSIYELWAAGIKNVYVANFLGT